MTTGSTPKISVVMSVYNGARFLPGAAESILAQTFQDFEFIILNDGSTDATADILKRYRDPRIKVLENQRNEGLTCSLIKGCAQARGEYIARMDADDVSYPARFQRELDFLESHPEYALVGTQCLLLDDKNKARGMSNYFSSNEEIRQDIWRRSPFSHGSSMMVREAFVECGGYREIFRYAQDYDLWFRIAERYKVANLPEPLYGFRYHRSSITFQKLYFQNLFVDLAREFARARQETGTDPIMSGNLPQVKSRVESWQPDGFIQQTKMYSDSALKLLEYMAPWGRYYDVLALWLAAIFYNPLNIEAWKFPFSTSFTSRVRRTITYRWNVARTR